MRAISNIMLSTDFSETAQAATDVAIEFAKKFGAKLTLLHVFDAPSYVGAFGDIYYAVPSTLTQDVRADAERALGKIAKQADEAGVAAETLVVEGTARDGIVAVAQSRHIDLIVMGTHGRRGISRALLGSVAETVVRSAPCAVLTVSLRDNRDTDRRAA